MIRTQQAHLHVAALSHEGMSGKNNEDNYAVSSFVLAPNNPTPVVFAVVADGIGGHRYGEVAAEMVVNIISDEVSRSNGGNPIAIFQKAFYTASETIFARSEREPEREGMGATCACVLVVGEKLYCAWAGDSRIYLARSATELRRLTKDHTWVQEAVDKGILEPAQMALHPNAHVIRRYLGSPEPPEPDLRLRLNPGETDEQARANQGLSLRSGDKLLLCSDGLTDLVTDEEILAHLQTRDLRAAAQKLVNLANERGGHDNITIVLLGVPRKTSGWLGWLMGE
jgi:protein phosphatase